MENKDVKILIVDDEKHINRLIQINMERAGYKTVSAFDGEEALKMVESEKPDLIILDWMMPKKNGMETLKALKANPETNELPIVMLTAKAQDADVLKGWQSGVDCYLCKPFNPMELLTFVQRILEFNPEEDEDEDGNSPKRWVI